MGDDVFQAAAFLVVVDFARDAARAIVRHQDQVAAGDADVGGNAGPFGADGAFDDLDDDLGASRVESRDVVLRDPLLFRLVLSGGFNEVNALVERLGNDVPVVQERIFFEADVDERGFQAGLQIFDLALEDAGDDLFFCRALDGELLELAVLHDGDAIFERLGVDNDFFVEFPGAARQQLLCFSNDLFDDFHD